MGLALMTQAIRFLGLAPDVILAIFASCDISSVISVGKTCRYLHKLAFQKSVWVALIGDLQRRSILDSNTPDLRDLSTEELINLVKRLLTGPETWTPSRSHFTPEASKRIILHPTIPRGQGIPSFRKEAKLVCGGRYVLFSNWRALECWSVAKDQLVWKHMSALEFSSVLAFTADDSQGGDSLIVMICQRTCPRGGPRMNYIEIVDLDLRTGIHDVLLVTRAPETRYDDPFSCPKICGTLAAVCITSLQENHLIIDWKMKVSIVLTCYPPGLSLIALIPGHIILKTVSDGGEDEVHLIAADAVHRHGVPVAGLEGPVAFPAVSESQIPKLFTHRIVSSPFPPDPSVWQFFDQMSVRESPVRRGTYRLWLYMSEKLSQRTAHQFHATLCSFDLSFSGAPEWRWRARTHAPALRGMMYRQITYSGHTQVFDAYGVQHEQILPPVLASARGRVDLEGRGDVVDVAPYSGALTYATHASVVILYFR
ncbi:hypothetical protein FB451DRAFT_1266059 [Mycena latifolia]|nr:hypothetical protein FB451DRAFT_1266059 [Mycena latifolia]